MPIEGIGNLTMSFWSGKDWVKVIIPNVAHVPLLVYNLLSLKMKADRGHNKRGLTLHLKNGKTLLGPSVGKPNCLSARPLDSSDFALASIVRRGKSHPFSLWIFIRPTRPTGMYMRN